LSWSLIAIPLCTALWDEEATAWLAAQDVRGLAGPVAPHPLPTVEQFLAVVEQQGLLGVAWFEVEGGAPNAGMRRWDPMALDAIPGQYLGEVSLDPPRPKRRSIEDLPPPGRPPALTLQSPIAYLGFRKPDPLAVFKLAVELARRSGPLFVFDDNMIYLRVAAAGGDARALAAP